MMTTEIVFKKGSNDVEFNVFRIAKTETNVEAYMLGSVIKCADGDAFFTINPALMDLPTSRRIFSDELDKITDFVRNVRYGSNPLAQDVPSVQA